MDTAGKWDPWSSGGTGRKPNLDRTVWSERTCNGRITRLGSSLEKGLPSPKSLPSWPPAEYLQDNTNDLHAEKDTKPNDTTNEIPTGWTGAKALRYSVRLGQIMFRISSFDAGAPRNTFILIIPILAVLITFLFWYQTWFGRPLSDQEMGQYLSDTSVPHKTQHALAQLSNRMARGDGTTQRWYPEIVALAQNKEPQLRSMAAWVMGQDNHSQEFHQTLRKLVDDPAPLVRWNAALALARFGDAAGEPQLAAMLQPFTLTAPRAGTLKFRLKEQDAVQSGGIVASISGGSDVNPVDVVSPVAGKIARLAAQEGGHIAPGDAVAVIRPGEAQVFEALRALVVVGHPETLPEVEGFAAGVPGMSERVRQQALLTEQAIRQRATQSKGVK